MALIGDITWTFIEESETETEDIEVTYPDGKKEILTQPKRTYRTESFSNAYIYVKSIQYHTIAEHNKKVEILNYHIAGYESKEKRDADVEDFLFWENNSISVNDEFDHSANLWETCYNALKERDNFINLQDC